MRNFLQLISLLLFLSAAHCHALTQEYNVLMQFRGNDVTGICVMEDQDDGSVAGTIVNEFGVKAFDFTYANGKAKIVNVMGPLNKWYIRKVLRNDFTFLLSHIGAKKQATWKKRTISFAPDGEVTVSNKRFKINYVLTPIIDSNDNN